MTSVSFGEHRVHVWVGVPFTDGFKSASENLGRDPPHIRGVGQVRQRRLALLSRLEIYSPEGAVIN